MNAVRELLRMLGHGRREEVPSGTSFRGRPLAIDDKAESADPNEPAFVTRPPGAPVYHGFPLLDDIEVDGFRLGMIDDWEAEPSDWGDAFVEGPDGRRAGLVWEVGELRAMEEVMAPDEERNGVWAVWWPHAMTSRENARLNLATIVPDLKRRWS